MSVMRQAMLYEYIEDLNVSASLQAKRLVISPRSYGDDFFGSSILMIPAIALLLFGNPEDVVSVAGVVGAILLFLVGCVGCVSVNKTYDLHQQVAPGTKADARIASVSVFERQNWSIRRNNKAYMTGFGRSQSGIPLVIYVIFDEGCVWLNIRCGSLGKFGRLPFLGTLIRRERISYGALFSAELSAPAA